MQNQVRPILSSSARKHKQKAQSQPALSFLLKETNALDEGVRSGRIKRGDLILLESFGGGFTWGSALIRF